MNHYVSGLINYFKLSGRSSRTDFWVFVAVFIILLVVAITVDASYANTSVDDEHTAMPFTALVIIFHMIPITTLAVHRLHDADNSGAWIVVGFILPIVWFGIGFIPPTPGKNRYGPNPKNPNADNGSSLENMEKLEKAAALRKSGALTDEEFYDMKKKILNSQTP